MQFCNTTFYYLDLDLTVVKIQSFLKLGHLESYFSDNKVDYFR